MLSRKGAKENKAFTLVELSIVLIIIGLIIGTVTVGQELVDQARMTSFKRQLTKYDTAVSMFKLKYDDLPGDMGPKKASAYGFVARSGAQYRGDGNGEIGYRGTYPYIVYAESALFWRDLSDAGFIEEKFTGTIDGSNQYVETDNLDDYLPRTRLPQIGNPYINIYFSTDLASNAYAPINATGTDSTGFMQGRTYFNTKTAYMLDQKFDDGLPDSGNIIRYNTTNTACRAVASSPATYDLSYTTNNCSIVFKAGFDEQ